MSATVTPIDASRDEFDDLFAALCAGFDRGYTVDRRNGLRTAFVGKLSAVQVARVVEKLLGPDGPERMPTVREIWQAHRSLRAAPPRRTSEMERATVETWDGHANAILMRCALVYPGRDSRAGWELARRMADQFRTLAEDGDSDATYDALKAAMLGEYGRLPVAA